ncbi:MAG: HrpE/YscL family type III secretion apparatus protein [Desulfovibrio sp.]|nr:HrpE/YscL family type III secretion apparatus protein [Desulfovibrio sp.]
MGAKFQLIPHSVSPAPGTRILRAREYAQLLEADSLLHLACEQAEHIRASAEASFEEKKREGYEQGLLEGRMEQAEKMMETTLEAVEYIEKLEGSLVNIVAAAVRKIIGELDDRERIVRVVRTALLSVRSQQKVLVRVSPSDEAAVREALAVMMSASLGGINFLDVAADPRMHHGDCLLESELGVVDASLESQLKAIENALAGKFRGR